MRSRTCRSSLISSRSTAPETTAWRSPRAPEDAAFVRELRHAQRLQRGGRRRRSEHALPVVPADAHHPEPLAAGNQRLWYNLEVAKRRLLYTLDQLGLSDRIEDPGRPRLRVPRGRDRRATSTASSPSTSPRPTTPSASGGASQLGEPYRTLLGHFRHEIGHYYWDRLIRDSHALDGVPRALRRRARRLRRPRCSATTRTRTRRRLAGAVRHAPTRRMHPWEDWAETWAHYLHMTDTLETAAACGISLAPARADEPTLQHVPDPTARARSVRRACWTAGPPSPTC